MSKVNLYKSNGDKSGTFELPEHIFGVKVSDELLAQAVYVYLSNQRSSGAKTLTRSDVSLTTQKWYRQKGTGRARHGAKSAPIFVGGGIAHGPDGTSNFYKKMSKKMRRKSILGALTKHAERGSLFMITDADLKKTNEVSKLLQTLTINKNKVLLILSLEEKKQVQAWKNLANIQVTYAEVLNAYEVLDNEYVLLAENSITSIEKTFIKDSGSYLKKKEESVAKTTKAKTTSKENSSNKKSSSSKSTKKRQTTPKKSSK